LKTSRHLSLILCGKKEHSLEKQKQTNLIFLSATLERNSWNCREKSKELQRGIQGNLERDAILLNIIQ
jgi:hypothetical protein